VNTQNVKHAQVPLSNFDAAMKTRALNSKVMVYDNVIHLKYAHKK
jgi:hypothetical protein